MKARPLILVVDDQVPNIDLLEAYLVPQGYDVVRALSGEEALGILSQSEVDLLLLDVMMPGMDGFELTRRVRKGSPDRLLPIVLVTALREPLDRVHGIEAGCDDFLSKPFDRMELLARVRSLLQVKAYHELLRDYTRDLQAEVSARTAELGRALEAVKAGELETICRLAMAAEFRDRQTGAHIRRMSRYAAAIARKLGLDELDVEAILHASPMHDVGKIGIPDRILLKPGALTPDEWEIMKMHTVIGSRILGGSEAPYIKMGESIARCHHERLDGTGYPSGLKGSEIPIAARITAVADAFDALTSRRPYKEPLAVEDSIALILTASGTQFDPAAVAAFMSIPQEISEIWSQYQDDSGDPFTIPELEVLLLTEAAGSRAAAESPPVGASANDRKYAEAI